MKIELTREQIQSKEIFRSFVDKDIVPYVDKHDQEESIPSESIDKLSSAGYLGAIIPVENGGKGMNMITFGLLCEEIGRGSASLLSLITIHGMISHAIVKWGSSSQKAYWLPRLVSGEIIGAFGLTEPNIGSDAKNVETSATFCNGSYILNGEKKWISWGQIAHLFLVSAQCEGKPTAFLVERNTPGFETKAIHGILGFRSAMLAKVSLQECQIPAENILGAVGFGFSHVAGSALDLGRYSISCGCVGLAQACLEASISYVRKRKQGGFYLKDYQLIQKMIADMVTNTRAAQFLSYRAGYLKDKGDPESVIETSIAKYFASKMVCKVSSDAVQIHGANGCSNEYPVQRYFRDAKIMEIIEGSNQIQQILISKNAFRTLS